MARFWTSIHASAPVQFLILSRVGGITTSTGRRHCIRSASQNQTSRPPPRSRAVRAYVYMHGYIWRVLEANSTAAVKVSWRLSLPGPLPCDYVSGLNPVPLARPAPLLSYDKHVTPNERVTDFRTFVSGVKANHLKGGLRLRQCQEEVAVILKDRVLVGHALHNDLKVPCINRGLVSSYICI